MILLLGLSLVFFFGLVFFTCLRVAEIQWPGTALQWSAALLLGMMLVLLLFRPEEEIEVGEDPGVYFNAALAFIQQGRFHFEDPALARIDSSERALFRYGDASFMVTKDHNLWASDEQMDRVGAFFLTGYSLLLAVPMALGFSYGAFWVSPLLAIMVACVISFLGRWLTEERFGGWLTFALYLFHPLIVWNARCIRAEWPAAFLILAGLFLLFGHILYSKDISAPQSFLAGLALAAATWFHVTAVYVIIPTLLLSVWHSRSTRFWWFWWAGVVGGLVILFAQLLWISDPYWVLSSLLAGRRGWLALASLLIAIPALVGVRFLWQLMFHKSAIRIHRWSVVLGVLYVCIALLLIRFHQEQGRIPGLPAWTAAYISLTDFATVAYLAGRIMLVVTLLGVPLLVGRHGTAGRVGRWLFLVLGPASLTIGWSTTFMFESRRMLLALIPLLVFSGVNGAWWLGQCVAGGWTKYAGLGSKIKSHMVGGTAALVTILLLMSTAVTRGRLYRTWNYRGLFGFYSEMAEWTKASGDFIFGEYTQTTIPLERLSRLPALPLAWGYRSEDEYRRAEQVWNALVRDHPAEEFLLVTPFSGAIIPGLVLERIGSQRLISERLGRAQGRVPDGPHPFVRTLHLYRIKDQLPEEATSTYTRIMDGGQLGLAGHANRLPQRTIEIPAVEVRPEQPVNLKQLFPAVKPNSVIRIVVHVQSNQAVTPLHVIMGADEALLQTETKEITDGWRIIKFDCSGVSDFENIQIMARETFSVVAAFAGDSANTHIKRLEVVGPLGSIVLNAADLQWLRARSRLALPGRTLPRTLYVLAWSGHAPDQVARLAVKPSGAIDTASEAVLIPGWQWYALPLLPADGAEAKWYDFVVSPAWNSGTSGFPDDLGLLIHMIHLN